MAGLAIAIVLIPRVRWQYAMLPVINGKRFGRLFWVTIGLAMSMVAVVLLNYAQHTVLYVAAMALLFFAWPAVQSFLLAVTADMDRTGRPSAIAGLTAYVGVASGPLFAASLLDRDGFSVMLYSCAGIFSMSFLLLLRPVQAQDAPVGAISLSQKPVNNRLPDSSFLTSTP